MDPREIDVSNYMRLLPLLPIHLREGGDEDRSMICTHWTLQTRTWLLELDLKILNEYKFESNTSLMNLF